MIGESALVIAYIGRPSLGVGSEVEIANSLGVPVVLVHEHERQVSRQVLGNPAVTARIVFKSQEEALKRIENFLRSFTAQPT